MLKKNTITLLVVFAVLLAVIVVLQNNRETRLPEVALTPLPTQQPFLFNFGTETVAGLRIENQDGEAVAFKFVAADGLWIGIEPLVPASDVEQTGLPGLVAALGGVRVISVLAGGPAATDLGLAPANFESVITLTDGSTQSLSIGDAAPTSSGYYVISNDDDTPKLVSKPALDQLIGLVDNPPIIPTPTLTATITSTLGITGTVTVTPTIDLTATD